MQALPLFLYLYSYPPSLYPYHPNPTSIPSPSTNTSYPYHPPTIQVTPPPPYTENEIAVFQCPEIIGNYEPDRCLYDDISVVDSNTAEEASRKINDIIRVMHGSQLAAAAIFRNHALTLSITLADALAKGWLTLSRSRGFIYIYVQSVYLLYLMTERMLH